MSEENFLEGMNVVKERGIKDRGMNDETKRAHRVYLSWYEVIRFGLSET